MGVEQVSYGLTGYSEPVGTWNTAGDPGVYGAASDRYEASSGVAQWVNQVALTPGAPVHVAASYKEGGNRCRTATYTVYDSDGVTSLGAVAADQFVAAADFSAAGPGGTANFNWLGNFTPSGTTLTVKLSGTGAGFLVADTAWFDQTVTGVHGAAALAAVSTLTAGGSVSVRGAAAPAAVSTLAAAGSVSVRGAAAPACASILTAAGATSGVSGSAALASVSTLAAAGSVSVRGAAALACLATLTATATGRSYPTRFASVVAAAAGYPDPLRSRVRQR